MEKFLKKFLVEDWVVTVLSIPLLVVAGLASFLPKGALKVPENLINGEALQALCPWLYPSTEAVETAQYGWGDLFITDAWINIGLLFLIALVVLLIGNLLLKRPTRGLLWSFIIVFAISIMAQLVAKIGFIKAYGFEAVFFSVIFGLLIRNLFHIPEWLKPAVQGEFFIKIGVVCLGATILFRDFVTSGAAGIIQACIVVTGVWLFAFWLSRKMKVEERAGMTLSSGVTICGVSACIAAGGVAKVQEKHLSYIISVVLIIAVPMIYLMPFLAKLIVPLLTDDPTIQQEIAGAWIGGTVDTTSGVGAASAIYGDVANKTAMIVKATQNVLIGVVAFCIATYLASKSGNDGKLHRPSLRIVWDKFPKFVLGFILASLVFSLLQQYGIFPDAGAKKLVETGLAKSFSGFFFSLAFVCIGMDTRLKDIISKDNRNILYAFLGAQTFNIVLTFFVAWLMFGFVKPMLNTKTEVAPQTEQVVEVEANAAQVVEAPVAESAEAAAATTEASAEVAK